MDTILTLVFGSVGLCLYLVSTLNWRRITKGIYIDDEVVKRRKLFKNAGVLGMLILIAAMEYYFIFVLEMSSINGVVLVGLFMGQQRNCFEPYFNADTADDIENLCLYLRPFQTDTVRGFKAKALVRGVIGIKEPVEKYLSKELHRQIAQTFAIGNPNSSIPETISTTSLYASDEQWKDVITKLDNKAKVIWIRVGNTDGCKWELNHCIDNDLLKKTIFLIEDETALNLFKEELGSTIDVELSMDDGSRYSKIVYYSEQTQDWKAIELQSKQGIKSFVKSYLQQNPSLQEQVKRQKKVFGRNKSVNTKFPGRWWHAISMVTNPIAYVLFNKWNWKWITLFFTYLFTTCVLLGIGLYFLFPEEAAARIFTLPLLSSVIIGYLVLLLPFCIFAPRISWRNHNWGSRKIFSMSNKTLAKWLLAYFICSTALTIASAFQPEPEERSMALFEEAAEKYENEEYDEAFSLMEKSVELYPMPINVAMLGEMYANGEGTPMDMETALELYKMVADEPVDEETDSLSQVAIAYACSKCFSILNMQDNTTEALNYLQKAMSLGFYDDGEEDEETEEEEGNEVSEDTEDTEEKETSE